MKISYMILKLCHKTCLRCKKCDTFSVILIKSKFPKCCQVKSNEKKLHNLFSLKSSIFELYFPVCFDTWNYRWKCHTSYILGMFCDIVSISYKISSWTLLGKMLTPHQIFLHIVSSKITAGKVMKRSYTIYFHWNLQYLSFISQYVLIHEIITVFCTVWKCKYIFSSGRHLKSLCHTPYILRWLSKDGNISCLISSQKIYCNQFSLLFDIFILSCIF
jgi:hypothetical protein